VAGGGREPGESGDIRRADTAFSTMHHSPSQHNKYNNINFVSKNLCQTKMRKRRWQGADIISAVFFSASSSRPDGAILCHPPPPPAALDTVTGHRPTLSLAILETSTPEN